MRTRMRALLVALMQKRQGSSEARTGKGPAYSKGDFNHCSGIRAVRIHVHGKAGDLMSSRRAPWDEFDPLARRTDMLGFMQLAS